MGKITLKKILAFNFKRLSLFLCILIFPNVSLAQETLETQKGLANPSETNQEESEDQFRPAEQLSIRINIPATRLDLYLNGEFYHSYSIAVGSLRYQTPVQDFYISRIEWNPSWYPPDSDWAKGESVMPPGPHNPLGAVKLVMQNGILIHGTNKPSSVGRAVSHGCMRMHKQDVTDLAWEIQKRYSEKANPALRETYAKNRGRTYVVKLLDTVPVSIEYSQVELRNERLLLHPNRYWQKGFQEQLEQTLVEYPAIELNAALVKKLDKMRRKRTVELSIEELQVMSTPATAAPSELSPAGSSNAQDALAASP